jgi:hypothetical protein
MNSQSILTKRIQNIFEADMKNKPFFLLLLTAPVFFLAYVITMASFIVAGLSFVCAALFVIGMKPVSDRWYLGIPHVVMLGIVSITIAGRFFSVPHYIDYLNLALASLSLTSIGFFMVFPGPQRTILRLFSLVSGVIGLYAAFLVYQIGRGLMHPLQTSWNVIDALSGIYLLVFLPLIGICHIGAALLVRASPAGELLPAEDVDR